MYKLVYVFYTLSIHLRVNYYYLLFMYQKFAQKMNLHSFVSNLFFPFFLIINSWALGTNNVYLVKILFAICLGRLGFVSILFLYIFFWQKGFLWIFLCLFYYHRDLLFKKLFLWYFLSLMLIMLSSYSIVWGRSD